MRLVTDGAELGIFYPNTVIVTTGGVSDLTIVTSPVRTGSRSFRFYCGALHDVSIKYPLGNNKDEIFLKSVFLIDGWRNDYSISSPGLHNWWLGGALQGAIHLKPSQTNLYGIEAVVDAAAVEYIADVVQLNTWHLLETHVVKDSTSGTIEVKLDGTSILSYSGDTGSDLIEWAGFGGKVSDTPVNIYQDDLAINDASGTVDNSWCGDGRVIVVPLNGDGYYTEWLGESSSLYTLVDEIPPSTGDYLLSSAVGAKGTFTKQALSLPSGVAVQRLTLYAYADEDTESGKKLMFLLRKDDTDHETGNQYDLTVNAAIVLEDFPYSPYTYSAWTKSEIDSLEVGCESA